MFLPNFKVTVTHSGSDTDYENRVFSQIHVKRPENNVSTAVLLADNRGSELYDSSIDPFDEVKVYVKEHGGSYTQIFGGHVRQLQPTLSPEGATLQVWCKGYGQALFDTHCNQDYGLESTLGASGDTAKEILEHLVDNYINESFDDEPHAANTGYAITKTKISDLVNATTISYINNPYRRCVDVVNNVCQLVTAIRDGSAGAHWMVDTSKNLRFEYIGTDQVGWTGWWNTNAAGSTLTEGFDFSILQGIEKTEEYANHVVFVTDFRRPAYDYWTEDSGGAALWGDDATMDVSNSNAQYIVGSHSLLMDDNGSCWFPSGQNADWRVDKWGTEDTIPTLQFYMYKDAQCADANSSINLCNDGANYFQCLFSTFDPSATQDEWFHVTLPIGPYYATVVEHRKQLYSTGLGAPSWTSPIDYIKFITVRSGGVACPVYIDDLHFTGKIVRSAYNSTKIGTDNEVQKVCISRSAMDDSGVAADDSGTAARYAYAELLRRQTIPVTVSFTTRMRSDLLPGQKIHVHACKTSSGAYEIDSDMRVTMHQLDIVKSSNQYGYASTVTATSDVLNTFPVTGTDQYAMLTEYLLFNNAEATDMRAGAEVDLLIPMLAVDYG